MELNEKCIFFAGGKKFNAERSNNQSHILMNKTVDGLIVDVRLAIGKQEADKTIFNFSELDSDEKGKKIPSNTIYLEAYDDNMQTQKMSISDADISLAYDKEEVTELIIKVKVRDSGKTDHGKTQHVTTG